MPGIVAGAGEAGVDLGGRDGSPPRTGAPDPQSIGAQVNLDRAVEVRAKDARPDVAESGEGRGGGVPVVVVRPHGDECQRGSEGREQRFAGRGGTAVVSDLEDVDR